MNLKTQILGERLGLNFLLFFLSLLVLVGVMECSNTKITREQASTYYGFVSDSTTGNPVQNAEILQYQSVVDSSDSAGFYRFPTFGLSAVLSCRAAGYQLQTKTRSVSKNGDSIRVDFRLFP